MALVAAGEAIEHEEEEEEMPVHVAASKDDLPKAAMEGGAKFAMKLLAGTTEIEEEAFRDCS